MVRKQLIDLYLSSDYVGDLKKSYFSSNSSIELLCDELIPDVCDVEDTVSLVFNNECIVVSGLTYGLDDYYELKSGFPKIKEKSEIVPLIEAFSDKYIVCQLQRIKGHDDVADVWSNFFIQFWEGYVKDRGVSEIFVLPSKFNYWLIPSVQEQMYALPMDYPHKGILKKNYDRTAAKCNYSRNFDMFGFYHRRLE